MKNNALPDLELTATTAAFDEGLYQLKYDCEVSFQDEVCVQTDVKSDLKARLHR